MDSVQTQYFISPKFDLRKGLKIRMARIIELQALWLLNSQKAA
jgi:hypothetical protein